MNFTENIRDAKSLKDTFSVQSFREVVRAFCHKLDGVETLNVNELEGATEVVKLLLAASAKEPTQLVPMNLIRLHETLQHAIDVSRNKLSILWVHVINGAQAVSTQAKQAAIA